MIARRRHAQRAVASLNPIFKLNVARRLTHLRPAVAHALARPVVGLLESAVLARGANSMVFNSPLVASPVKSLFARAVKMPVFWVCSSKTSNNCRLTLIINYFYFQCHRRTSEETRPTKAISRGTSAGWRRTLEGWSGSGLGRRGTREEFPVSFANDSRTF